MRKKAKAPVGLLRARLLAPCASVPRLKGPVDLSRPRSAVRKCGRWWKPRWGFHGCVYERHARVHPGALDPGSKAPSARKTPPRKSSGVFFVRKMGLEPTQACTHKILSLARLPVPTLPLMSGSTYPKHGCYHTPRKRKSQILFIKVIGDGSFCLVLRRMNAPQVCPGINRKAFTLRRIRQREPSPMTPQNSSQISSDV